MIQTRQTCVISMAHLTTATAESLMNAELFSWPVLGAPMGPDMLMVWAPTDLGAHDLPDDLRLVLEWARIVVPAGESPATSNGYDYVIFDRNVDPSEDGSGLRVYGVGKADGDYLERFPAEHRPTADRAYTDGFQDGFVEATAEMQGDVDHLGTVVDRLDRTLRDLIGEARAYYADHITHPEGDPRPDRAPEGDDFNALFSMVEATERLRLDALAPRRA